MMRHGLPMERVDPGWRSVYERAFLVGHPKKVVSPPDKRARFKKPRAQGLATLAIAGNASTPAAGHPEIQRRELFGHTRLWRLLGMEIQSITADVSEAGSVGARIESYVSRNSHYQARRTRDHVYKSILR